jgi:hypothetical protein
VSATASTNGIVIIKLSSHLALAGLKFSDHKRGLFAAKYLLVRCKMPACSLQTVIQIVCF